MIRAAAFRVQIGGGLRALPLAPYPGGAPFRRCAPAPLGGEPLDVTRRRKMKMAVYMAMDGNGKRVNLVEIEEGQVMGWERATGMKLVKVEEADGEGAAGMKLSLIHI